MMKNWIWAALSAAFLLANRSASAQDATRVAAKPFLHPLFSENAVLQRDRPISLWGWTQPNTSVQVQFDAQKQTARAGLDGRWTVSIPSHAAGGPHSLIVTGAGGQSLRRTNLLFGDVWLCGGQSNMAYDLYGAKNPEAEIAAANYPDIRLMDVPNAITAAPLQSFEETEWKVCSPQTVGKFSGTGYFFGRELHKRLKVPIGLVNSSWSGTPAQSWVSGPALSTMPDFKSAADALQASRSAQGTLAEQMQAWWKNEAGTLAHQEAPAFDDAAWKSINLPGEWDNQGFPGFDGVMWFRRTVDVPAAWAGRDLQLNLGNIDDIDTTYWNGVPIGATDGFNRERNYTVPGAQVKAGRIVLAVRVLDTGGGGGLVGPALSMKSGGETVSLQGQWKLKAGKSLQELPLPSRLDDPNAPVVLFNGKIAPLVPGQFKGVIWYQGESNADNAEEAQQYRTLLPLLIRDWRAHLGAQLPFYIVQLANFRAPRDEPMSDDVWPLAREAQLQTSQLLPNAPLVVTIDLGEEKDVHYRNKQEVGARLALSALAKTYGVRVESSGPTLRESKAINGVIQLSFDHAQGLNLKGDANRVFAIAGADGKFVWATPRIVGDVVTLRSPDVPKPLYARFGWSDNPLASLYNAAGLPASPFRTDK